MLGHRILNVQDYTTILKRRWWVIVLPMVILSLTALGVSFLVDPQYVSQTLVLIEQQKVPEDYVRPVVAEDLNSRLASMQEQILSRSRLQPIIERFNLYGNSHLGMDARIDKVRKDITIRPIQSEIARSNGLPGFFISFRAGDPHTAQSVCSEITSLFLSQNLHEREQASEETTDFMKGQLEDAKRNLDEQDAKLAQFQQTYMGKLPGDEGASMNMLVTLSSQLDATTQSIARMEQDKTYAETVLAQQVRESKAPPGQHGPQEQQAEMQQLQAQEADLASRYTDDYPDVVAVRRKIEELKAEMAKTPKTASAPAETTATTDPTYIEPAHLMQLRAQIKSLDLEIAQKRHDQAKLQSQIGTFQSRLEASPGVQEQYKNLTRDYQTAQGFYDDLLKRLNQSKMATDLERRQQGEQFKLLDAPNLPESPTFPNRTLFFTGGLFIGALFGLMFAALLEYKNTEIRSEHDIWSFTRLPTLGVIGLASDEQKTEPKNKRFGFGRRKQVLATGN
jgi:polysaccharide chain length determinant protein (PEP-CTERM system associated)